MVTFCTMQKVTSRIPCRENRGSANLESTPKQLSRTNKIKTFPKGDSRFCKPRISPPEQQLHTNKIKTFPKGDSRFCKPRISTQNNNFARTQLNPFAASRRCPCRDGTLRVLFPPTAVSCCCRNIPAASFSRVRRASFQSRPSNALKTSLILRNPPPAF